VAAPPARLSTWKSLQEMVVNPRIRAVALQSFSSGLPLGLIWIAAPAWLKYLQVDIKTIGLFSLTQAPWNFKFLWSPLMDRFSPGLGRKRGWMLLTELALVLGIALLAYEAVDMRIWAVFLLGFFIAFSAASQDIVIDGYAVEVLEKPEFGRAVGSRVALYRVAMYLSSGLAITMSKYIGWPLVFAYIAALFVPMMYVAWRSPEPVVAPPPPKTLRAAVFAPMAEMFRKRRALEVLSFIVLYKLGENLATALIRPFLIEKGFPAEDVGIVITGINVFAGVGGTVLGGVLTDRFGMGRTLWISGFLQAIGCLGYAVVDQVGGPTPGGAWVDPHRFLMYGALALETVFQGMGAGALGVLMLRLTSKEFSATQFALLSSLMALPRVIVGPFAGVLVDAVGWTPFFILTLPVALPGLVMLNKFVPFGSKEPQLEDEVSGSRVPVTIAGLVARALGGLLAGLAIAFGWISFIDGVKDSRAALKAVASYAEAPSIIAANVTHRFQLMLSPQDVQGWVKLLGPIVFAILIAMATAGLVAARRGVATKPAS
jgi:MFS transporter, PAT family, beta-lactamase induction signal transducer AmpG